MATFTLALARRCGWLALVVLVAWPAGGIGLAGAVHTADAAPDATAEAGTRLQSAAAIQAATRARLGVLSEAASCADAGFITYRRSDIEPELVDEWYVASQVWADAALLRVAGDEGIPDTDAAVEWRVHDALCHLNKAIRYVDRLWDDDGGYYPRSDPAGAKISRSAQYADDNALTGLALLAAAEAVGEGSRRERYLRTARDEAEFLVESGLWDDTFGGGFWWSTDRGVTLEGKPAQTNALAALFFAQLYDATGARTHRTWALRTLAWLDGRLYDPTRKLYRWSVRYTNPAARSGPAVVSNRYFNYDQGIAIEAQLLAARLDGDRGRLARARAVGDALHGAFWNRDKGGYNLEAGVEQVYASYAAWTSLGHLALYGADGDPRWLERARANAEALETALREVDSGYAYRHYRCVDRIAPGCGSGRVASVVDHTRDTAAQAWVQHLQAAIAGRLIARAPRAE